MITVEQTDEFMLALTLWREARGQSKEAIQAVESVIRNRVARLPTEQAADFPLTRVVLKRKQFSCHNPDDPNAVKLPTPTDAAGWRAWKLCLEVIGEQERVDATRGATHYHSGPASKVYWADPAKVTARIGAFTFYKGV